MKENEAKNFKSNKYLYSDLIGITGGCKDCDSLIKVNICRFCFKVIEPSENYNYNPYSTTEESYVKCCWRHIVREELHANKKALGYYIFMALPKWFVKWFL